MPNSPPLLTVTPTSVARSGFVGMYGYGNPYSINAGIFDNQEQLASLDLLDTVQGSGLTFNTYNFDNDGIGRFLQAGASSYVYMRNEMNTYPYYDSGAIWWIDWDGTSLICRNPGNQFLQFYPAAGVYQISPSYVRPNWFSSTATMVPTADGQFMFGLESYLIDLGGIYHYSGYSGSRVRLYSLTETAVADTSQTVDYAAAPPAQNLPSFFINASAQVGPRTVIWMGRYTINPPRYTPLGLGFLIMNVDGSGNLNLIEVDTHFLSVGGGFVPEAGQRMIPVEGWTDKILIGYEKFQYPDWNNYYFVLHIDGTMSNIVSIPAYSVEMNDFYGDPYIDASSDSWVYNSGGGIGGTPYAMYMFNEASGDPDSIEGQTWRFPIKVQKLAYSDGVLSVAESPLELSTTDYTAVQDNEWPNFVAAGNAWMWKYDANFPASDELLAATIGSTAQTLITTGYRWYDYLVPTSEFPNLAGAFERRKRVFPRGPTNYTP